MKIQSRYLIWTTLIFMLVCTHIRLTLEITDIELIFNSTRHYQQLIL